MALVLVWAGGRLNHELSGISDATWIGLGILVVTGLPWSALDFLDVDGPAGLLLCSLLNGAVIGMVSGVVAKIRQSRDA